jgi:hypothetical protein
MPQACRRRRIQMGGGVASALLAAGLVAGTVVPPRLWAGEGFAAAQEGSPPVGSAAAVSTSSEAKGGRSSPHAGDGARNRVAPFGEGQPPGALFAAAGRTAPRPPGREGEPPGEPIGEAARTAPRPPGIADARSDGDAPSSRSVILRRLSHAARAGSSDGWYWAMGGISLLMAVCGGLVASARRFLPQPAGLGVQVVSRVSLSPKHAVYVLRAGRRVLLVGSGPQGPPALISELDDAPETEPSRRRGDDP